MPINIGQDEVLAGAATEVSDSDLANSGYSFYISGSDMHAKYKNGAGTVLDKIVGAVNEVEQVDVIQLGSLDGSTALPQLRIQNGYARSYTYQWRTATPQFQPNERTFNLIVPKNSDISATYHLDIYWNSSVTTGNVTWEAEGFTCDAGSSVAVTPLSFGIVTDSVSGTGDTVMSTIDLDFAGAGFGAGEPFFINLFISGATTGIGSLVNLFNLTYRYTLK